MPVAAPLVLESMLKTFFDPSEAYRVSQRMADLAGTSPSSYPTTAETALPDPAPERGPGSLVAALRAAVAWTRRPIFRPSRRDATLG